MKAMIRALVRTPVLIFQMGKVGSSSLEHTLSRRHNGPVIHAHSYAGLTAEQQRLLSWRKRLRLPIHVISPVREPIARNISAFFHNFRRDTGMELESRNWSVDELCDLFLERYPHNTCLDWFDAHLRPSFGIDVLSEAFPVESKWQTYRHGSVRLLVYRSDLDHAEQLEVISHFLGQKIDDWAFANRSEDKDYANLYQAFCRTVTLPKVYLSVMYGSRFARKFYSENELAAFARRWHGKVGYVTPEGPARILSLTP